MKKEHKARLQIQHTVLVETLEPHPLFDLCFQNNGITSIDLERIRAERSRPDKVELFLEILESKSADSSYKVFCEALCHTDVGKEFVVKLLDETVLPDDVQEDCRQRAEVEQILRDHFVVQEDGRYSKTDLMKFLRHQLRCRNKSMLVCELDVLQIVSCVFPQVYQHRNKKGNVCSFIGVCKKKSLEGEFTTGSC